MPIGWDNFYIMAGSASATLIGLLFVIVTMGTGSRLSGSSALDGISTFLTPTFAHFGGVLFQSLAVLPPWPSVWPVGIILGLTGLVGLAYSGKVMIRQRKVAFVTLQWLDWSLYRGLPAVANAGLIVGAVGLIAGKPCAPYAVAGAAALLMFVGVYGAWDLTLWLLKNRETK